MLYVRCVSRLIQMRQWRHAVAAVASSTTGSVTPRCAATMTPRRRRRHYRHHRGHQNHHHLHHPRPRVHYYLFLCSDDRNRFWHTLYRSHTAQKQDARRGCISDVHRATGVCRRGCRGGPLKGISTAMDESHNLNPCGHSRKETLYGQTGNNMYKQ